MDADGWRRILFSTNFGDANVDLRKAIGNFMKKIFTVSAISVEAFAACPSSLWTKTQVFRSSQNDR